MGRGEVIRIRDEFYIRSSSPRVDVRTRVLKQDPRNGNVVYAGTTEGLYKTTDAGRTWTTSGRRGPKPAWLGGSPVAVIAP